MACIIGFYIERATVPAFLLYAAPMPMFGPSQITSQADRALSSEIHILVDVLGEGRRRVYQQRIYCAKDTRDSRA